MTQAANLIARQPICTKKLKTIGYEILYRMAGSNNTAIVDNPDGASIDVLLALFNDLSLADVVDNKLAFINFTGNLLVKGLPNIPPKQLVIELLEDQEITDELINALLKLKKQGYRIALDDFTLNSMTMPLVEYANIIKIDVLSIPPGSWKEFIPPLKEKGVIFLAEKVESYEIFEECCDLGFDLFQGYFYEKPKIIAGKRLGNNQQTVLKLLNEINKSNIDINVITQLISNDVNISYNLLRTINSGLYGLPTEITSVKHAITLLGLANLKNWVNIISLSTLNDKPQLLTETAMLRAKMCEALGEMINHKQFADQYFTLGLFSLIDTFFDISMEDILKKLSLSSEMEKALRFHQGIMGDILNCVIAHQTGHWDHSHKNHLIEDGKLTMDKVTEAYLASVKWMEENRL